MSKLQIPRAKVANTKRRGRIDFYSTLNTCRMRIKAKEGEFKITNSLIKDLDLG